MPDYMFFAGKPALAGAERPRCCAYRNFLLRLAINVYLTGGTVRDLITGAFAA